MMKYILIKATGNFFYRNMVELNKDLGKLSDFIQSDTGGQQSTQLLRTQLSQSLNLVEPYSAPLCLGSRQVISLL